MVRPNSIRSPSCRGRVPSTVIAVDARRARARQAVEHVTACGGIDLGVPPRHRGVAEEADLRTFIQADAAPRVRQQSRSGPPAGRS